MFHHYFEAINLIEFFGIILFLLLLFLKILIKGYQKSPGKPALTSLYYL